jgi:hypothetical protein
MLGWRPAITFLGSVTARQDYSLLLLLLPSAFYVRGIGTATFLHDIERDDIGVTGYKLSRLLIVFLVINIIYIYTYARSHVYIHDATNRLIIIFFLD